MSFPLSKYHSQWEKDSSVSHCNICKIKLLGNLFTSGKHHCRKCGRIICAACSNHKYMNHKVCGDCNRHFSALESSQSTPFPIRSPTTNGYTIETLLLPSVTAIYIEKSTAIEERIAEAGNVMDTTKKPLDHEFESTPHHGVSPSPQARSISIDAGLTSTILEKPIPIPPPRRKTPIPPPRPQTTADTKPKRDRKATKKRKKNRKHRRRSKHKRNSAHIDDVIEDISSEIFLKLLLTVEELIKDEGEKKKRRRKKKKKRKHRSHKKKGHRTHTKTHTKKGETCTKLDVQETMVEKKAQHDIIHVQNHTEDDVPQVHRDRHERLCGQSMLKHSDKWKRLNANAFQIRPKNYYAKKRKGKKVPSTPALYEVTAMDAYVMEHKATFMDVVKQYDIDIERMIGTECQESLYLPYLVIVNVILPLNKGEQSMQYTFYSQLSPESEAQMRENNISEAMQLFGDFCKCEDEEDDIRNDFKVTVRVNNLSKTTLPFLMRKLIGTANGQSIAIKENVSYHLDPGHRYFIVDIDMFGLSKQMRSMWNKACLCLDSMVYDVAFHIGAHDVNYLPEQILLCTQINKLSITDMTSIDKMKTNL